MATTGLFEHANINAPKSGKYSAEYASRKMYSIGENILINATSAKRATADQIATNISSNE